MLNNPILFNGGFTQGKMHKSVNTSIGIFSFWRNSKNFEVYSEPCRRSKMELFATIVQGFLFFCGILFRMWYQENIVINWTSKNIFEVFQNGFRKFFNTKLCSQGHWHRGVMREVLAVFFLVKLFLQGSAGIFCCQQTLPTSFIMIFLTQPCDFFDTYV